MASSPSEHEIQQRIRLACGRGTVRLWRNNTGALVDQQGRFVRFGLCKGSSDLIGLRSLEVKTESGTVSTEQRAFLQLVQQLGGLGAVCRSIEEARTVLDLSPPGGQGA